MDKILDLRRQLHRQPERSGAEAATARRLLEFFEPLGADLTLTGLGGHGLAFVFQGSAPGPTVLLRADLDALPGEEDGHVAHRSTCPGVAHLCGHDGHMAILAAVGTELAARRPGRGRAVLLFQPAEENGTGARAVLADERFAAIVPDHVFALHNLPGFALGEVVVRPGTFCCASKGLAITLRGTTGHAAQPETGNSPAAAMCDLMTALPEVSRTVFPQKENAFLTVVGAELGEGVTFGTTPARAIIRATLRSETDEVMAALEARVEHTVRKTADRDGLGWDISFTEEFPATVNASAAVEAIRTAAGDAPVTYTDRPFRWSEDFGHFTARYEGALFGIGAGKNVPALHHPGYDFPDELIAPAVAIFLNILARYLS